LDHLVNGLSTASHPQAVLMIILGVGVGLLVGAAPGIGPTLGMIVLLPFALKLSPENGILLLVSVLVGSGFGNSIPAVLLNVPGTNAAMLACVEGHPFHRRGESGRALLVSLIAAVTGQFVSIFIFILFVIPLAHWGIKLLFPEMFAIVLVGLFAAAAFVNRQIVKGLVAVAVGLLLTTIGPDPITGQLRLTFGSGWLATGLSEIPVITGLLAFREIFRLSENLGEARVGSGRMKIEWFPRLKKGDLREISLPVAWGVAVGTIVGAIPGAGGSIASFLNYQLVRTVSRDKSQFGKGSLRGLASVEAPNNAVIGGELIPTFGLGIPGAAPMVIIMTLLSAEGIQPGPNLIHTNPLLLYATFGGLLVATLVKIVMGYAVIGPSIYLSRLSPTAILVTAVLFVMVGIYSLRWSLFDVKVALAMGVLGYLLERFGYSVVAVALAFILGGILESSLRRGLVMTFGWQGFFSRPVTLGVLIVGVVMAAGPAFPKLFGLMMRSRVDRAKSVAGVGDGE
jgi:putative tricarboxylic transport membrane protein